MSVDHLAVLDALPIERVPAAIARLSARLLTPAPAASAADRLTVEEVAKLLNVGPRYVYKHKRELGAIYLSKRKMRFPRVAVERFLKGRQA